MDHEHIIAVRGVGVHLRRGAALLFAGAVEEARKEFVASELPEGLYLAGGSAHPGPGMPMVLMSGWIAGDTVDKDRLVERSAPARSPA